MLTYLGCFPHICTTANSASLGEHHFPGVWVPASPNHAWGLRIWTAQLAANKHAVQAVGSLKTQVVHTIFKQMLSNSGFRERRTQAIISKGPAAQHEQHRRHSKCLPGEQSAAQPPSASKSQRCRPSLPSCVAYCAEKLVLPRAAVRQRGDGTQPDSQIRFLLRTQFDGSNLATATSSYVCRCAAHENIEHSREENADWEEIGDEHCCKTSATVHATGSSQKSQTRSRAWMHSRHSVQACA